MSEAAHHAVGASLHGWNRELRWLIAICLLVIVLVATLIAKGFTEAQTPGVTDNEIRIGVTMGLDGLIAPIGLDCVEGLRTAVEAANLKGGVHGRRIKLVGRNDGYEPLQCVLNTRDLIAKESVFALASYLGTATSIKAQPIWTGAKVPVIGFFTGATPLREPFNPYNFHVRASYRDEIHALVNLYANDLRVKRVAILYQYDLFGQSVRRETKELLAQHNLRLVAEGSYPRNTTEVESALKAILAGDPEAVIMIGTIAPLVKFVKLIRANTRQPVYLGSASFVGGEIFLDTIGKEGEGCYVSHVMPLFSREKSRVLLDFQRDTELVNPGFPVTSVGLEGYIYGRVLVEGLERAGRKLTRERFIHALETIHGQPFGPGYDLSFSSKNHEGSSRVFLTQIRKGKYESLDVKD
ncbi:MAG: hypothetical protein B9S32_15410 [Verrucomicrobia bacterium Tous-C9LFEB]|nr:MAG: hypothetical protein B9S32_15410 [Verrucomicrobia bacterium Tous-C9LFEB]